jgi:atypical dual specificity phosphatase
MGRTGRVYRKVRAQLLAEPTHFSWVIGSSVAASGLPSSERQIDWLSRRGIDSVLSLTETPLNPRWFDGKHIEVKHIPMKDHEPPSLQELKDAMSHINTELKRGKIVHIHCLAGTGRTGTVIAAYLMASKDLSTREAIDTVRQKRPGSVEWRQEKALLSHEQEIRALKLR